MSYIVKTNVRSRGVPGQSEGRRGNERPGQKDASVQGGGQEAAAAGGRVASGKHLPRRDRLSGRARSAEQDLQPAGNFHNV